MEASELGDFVAMTTANTSDRFYGSIPVFRGFGSLMDPALYSPLPDDWTVGVADIVESTKAIAAQRCFAFSPPMATSKYSKVTACGVTKS